jgi:hypothetical protein
MIKFYYNNLLDDAGLDPTSENAQFPASNIQDNRRTKVFRSTSNEDDLVLDFGANEDIDSFFIVDNHQDGFGISDLTIKLNSTTSFATPLATHEIDLNNKFGQGFKKFNSVSARYMKMELDSTLGYCELANFFIGKELELIDGKSINFGWTHQDRELINKSFNRNGQQFSDLIGTQKVFNVSFTNLTKDQLEQLDNMYDQCGTFKPFFVRIGCPDITNQLERYSGMVYLSNKPTKTNTFFNRYGLSMEMVEAR